MHAFHEASACPFEGGGRSSDFLCTVALLGDSRYREACRFADVAAHSLDWEL